MLFIPYDTGTITLNNGETSFTGTDTAWEFALVKPYTVIIAGGVIGIVASIEGEVAGTLKFPWAGGDLDAADYQMLIPVDDGIELQDEIRNFFIGTQATTVMYAVPGSAPDNSLGNDGQFAAKVNAAPWKFWKKVDGEWVLLGTPSGINPRGAYDPETNYLIGDWVSSGGRGWISKAPSTGQLPAEGSDYWDPATGVPSRLEIRISDIGKPGASEMFVRELCTNAVTFLAGLSEAKAIVTVAPTADAVFSIRKLTAAAALAAADGPAELVASSEFATCTIAASQKAGVFACAADATFAAGDVFLIVGPDPQDETLSGLSMSIVAYGS